MISELEDKDVLNFDRVFNSTIAGRKMATKNDGSWVFAPWHTCAGDVVAIFPGGRACLSSYAQRLRAETVALLRGLSKEASSAGTLVTPTCMGHAW